MPLTWAIDHRTRMVVATGEGILGLEDFEKSLDELARPATLSYRKLVDLAQCSLALSEQDLLALSDRMNDLASVGARGALAIVATSDDACRQARAFEALAVADRPIRIFREVAVARDWLEALARVRTRPMSRDGEGLTLRAIVDDSPEVDGDRTW